MESLVQKLENLQIYVTDYNKKALNINIGRWGSSNEGRYKEFENDINKLSISCEHYNIYINYDVSGWEYWCGEDFDITDYNLESNWLDIVVVLKGDYAGFSGKVQDVLLNDIIYLYNLLNKKIDELNLAD